MRSAILRLPDSRTASERRHVLRAAIRQLERSQLYIAAVGHMELDDTQARHGVRRLAADLETLRRYIVELRAGIRE